MNIIEVAVEEFSQIYPLIKELRPHLEFTDFELLFNQAKLRDEYRIVGIRQNNHYIAIMGYRILFDFVHGKHLYINDLVVTDSVRSQGFGQQLLYFAELEAKKHQCQGIRLSTGVENKRAMSFYEKNHWSQRAVVYKKKLEAFK